MPRIARDAPFIARKLGNLWACSVRYQKLLEHSMETSTWVVSDHEVLRNTNFLGGPRPGSIAQYQKLLEHSMESPI